MDFEVLDISGDVGIRASGATPEEVLVNIGTGMFSLITDMSHVEARQQRDIEVKADSLEGLLVRYLNELVFQFDTYSFIGKSIEIREFEDSFLRASVSGEEFDLKRHDQRLLIKAATYHNLRFVKVNDRWEAEVMFDI